MTRDRQAREELDLLVHIELQMDEPGGRLYGCRPAKTLARDRCQRKGLIVRRDALQGKAGHINRWFLSETGRALLETTRKAAS